MPKIEIVREDDPDYAIFEAYEDEPATPLEECGELFDRVKTDSEEK